MELKQSPVRSTQKGTKSGAERGRMSDLFLGLSRPHRPADIVVGLGARGAATTGEVLALIDTVLAGHNLDRRHIAACVTVDRRWSHPALREAAEMLGVELLSRNESALGHAVPNPSAKVTGYVGVASVAEAAALTFGPLIAEKHRSANATCALSRQSPIAAIAASTLSTSRAGP